MATKQRRHHKVRYLPAAPLHSAIRRHERLYGSLRELSQHIAGRLDCSYETANRNLFKVLRNAERVDEKLADKIACGMGYHPFEIFGNLVFEEEAAI